MKNINKFVFKKIMNYDLHEFFRKINNGNQKPGDVSLQFMPYIHSSNFDGNGFL